MSQYPHHEEPHYVYWCYDANGQVLYIGCTYNPPQRLRAHRNGSHWAPKVARTRIVGPFPGWSYAHDVECRAIAAERPWHNIAHNPRFCPEPDTTTLSPWQVTRRAAAASLADLRAASAARKAS